MLNYWTKATLMTLFFNKRQKIPRKKNIDLQTGEEFLVWDTERCTKTRTGERPMDAGRSFSPKAYATGCKKCPVVTWKILVSTRPSDMMSDGCVPTYSPA